MTTLGIGQGSHSLNESTLEHNPNSSPRIDFSNAPELSFSNAPELNHNPQNFPPEVIAGPVSAAEHEGLQPDNPFSEKTGASKRSCTKKRWAGLFVIVIIIIAAAVGGAVGGTVGRKTKLAHMIERKEMDSS